MNEPGWTEHLFVADSVKRTGSNQGLWKVTLTQLMRPGESPEPPAVVAAYKLRRVTAPAQSSAGSPTPPFVVAIQAIKADSFSSASSSSSSSASSSSSSRSTLPDGSGGGGGGGGSAVFRKGEKVEARWAGQRKFFPGHIAMANRDGTYDIDYDDG